MHHYCSKTPPKRCRNTCTYINKMTIVCLIRGCMKVLCCFYPVSLWSSLLRLQTSFLVRSDSACRHESTKISFFFFFFKCVCIIVNFSSPKSERGRQTVRRKCLCRVQCVFVCMCVFVCVSRVPQLRKTEVRNGFAAWLMLYPVGRKTQTSVWGAVTQTPGTSLYSRQVIGL